jgi:hypothetical protein
MPSFSFVCAEANRRLSSDISISDISDQLSTEFTARELLPTHATALLNKRVSGYPRLVSLEELMKTDIKIKKEAYLRI